MPMAMTGQYSCTFQSPLAERAYENSGDGTPNEWFEDLSSTIQLVTARFIVCIHWSSRFPPSILTRVFAASLHLEPVSWALSESKHPGRRSRGAS
ncbi:unnamed protein product [Urochloa decumbens]|uniref:Uncharacterized protein n=1 Tax=Urochloa decumbens TaxID=240449 RepID=A0ABC8ZD90_9POAL